MCSSHDLGCVKSRNVDTKEIVEKGDATTLNSDMIHSIIHSLVSQKLDASPCPVSFKWIWYVLFTY